MTEVENEVAVITGSGTGIGRGIAERFLENGIRVLGCGRGSRPADLPEAMEWVTADVSSPEDVRLLRRVAEKMNGRIRCVVNNAGIQIEKKIDETTDQDWDELVGANCRGVFNVCREFIPVLTASGGGSIVNIGSISGNFSDPGLALYNASKGFVHALTRSIAVDHGPAIRCNAVCPGWIMTKMSDAAFEMCDSPEAGRKDALARHPAGRFGQPRDIANIVFWLCSVEASFVTGQCFTVDGGLTAASPVRTELY